MTERLTPATARSLQPGQMLRDHEVVGLQLIASRTRKSWHLYYKTRAGAERRPKLGAFPEMSLSSARSVAKDLKERVARGEDPSAEWRAQRAAPTVDDLCDRFLTEWGPKHNTPRTLHEKKLLIDRHIRPGLGSMKIADVTREDVDAFLEKVLARRYVPTARKEKDGVEQAPSAANHVRACLRHLFNLAWRDFKWSIQKIEGVPVNPVSYTVKQYTAPRQRLARPHELRAILTRLGELEAHYPAHVAAIWALFFSGGRVGEIEKAGKAQLDGRALILNRHKTFKAIGTKRVRLPVFVVEMIDKLDVKGDRLFGDIALKRIWQEIRTSCGCPDLQMRDARRTFASYALQCGYMLDAIGKLLGHTNVRTTSGYAWLVEDSGDEMVERVAESMRNAGAPKPLSDGGPSAAI